MSMILTSIAMEELALSHILNAEGEKLQAVLKHLESPGGECCGMSSVDKLLEVNKSVAGLLDSVSQNQMLLKSKMDKVLEALSCKHSGCGKSPCPCKPGPQPCKKCSAVFKGTKKCQKWCPGAFLNWSASHQPDNCVSLSRCDPSKIEIHKKGRFLLCFSLSVKGICEFKQQIAVCLKGPDNKTLHTLYQQAPRADAMSSVSMGGILLDTSGHDLPYAISLKLGSSNPLMVEHASLSIAEL
jgi:hypothetical protein